MSDTNSRRVAKCATIVRTVATAGETCADEIVALLDSLLFPDGPPPNLTLRDFILALVAFILSVQAELEARDRFLAKELGDDVAARDERDEQQAKIRKDLVSIRALIESLFGDLGLARAGLAAPIPTNNDSLIQLANSSAEQIETNSFGSADGVTLDRAAIAGKLRGSAQSFRSALDTHKTEQRETQLARASRDIQLDLWFQVYPGVADVLAGLATIAGRPDIANRVRPTAGRRAGEPEPIDLEPPPDPSAGDLTV